jgi:hypothetical protein
LGDLSKDLTGIVPGSIKLCIDLQEKRTIADRIGILEVFKAESRKVFWIQIGVCGMPEIIMKLYVL